MDAQTRFLCLQVVKALTPQVLGRLSPFAGMIAASKVLSDEGISACAVSENVENPNVDFTLPAAMNRTLTVLGLVVGDEVMYFSGPAEWEVINLQEGVPINGTRLKRGWKWTGRKNLAEHRIFAKETLDQIDRSTTSLQSEFDRIKRMLKSVIDRVVLESATLPSATRSSAVRL